MPDVFTLSAHATWRCGHSGACCSSNWPIEIDAHGRSRIAAAVASHAIEPAADAAPFVSLDTAPGTPVTLLGRTIAGGCTFFDLGHDADAGARPSGARADATSHTGRCRVQRALGHDALPLACRMFPRVCLIDTRGVRVSLSHYCPTAAARLFDRAPLTIVRGPAAFPPDGEYDGLDARDTFPPLLRPGVLLDWETLDALEAFGVRLFAEVADAPNGGATPTAGGKQPAGRLPDGGPSQGGGPLHGSLAPARASVESALAGFAATCEALRTWRAADGPMIARLRLAMKARLNNGAIDRDDPAAAAAVDWPRTLSLDADVRAAVPADLGCPPAPGGVTEAYERAVAPVWPQFAAPVARYLAARLFGSWCWYQGRGVRTLVRSLEAALAVLRVETARQTVRTGRMLEGSHLREAIRHSDRLLLHLASREALAARWSAAEGTTS